MNEREVETIVFRTTGEDGDEHLIREYVFDAVDRLPDRPDCTGVGFTPLARKRGLAEIDAEGGVLIRFWGDDVDAIVEQERDRWDNLVETGTAESWEWADDGALVTYMGEQGADCYLQFQGLATRLSKLVYDEFDEAPDPVDMYPGEEREAPAGVGWWRLLHELTIQQNYRYGEELDAFVEAIRWTIRAIAEFDEPERALRETDAVIESLETLQEELEA